MRFSAVKYSFRASSSWSTVAMLATIELIAVIVYNWVGVAFRRHGLDQPRPGLDGGACRVRGHVAGGLIGQKPEQPGHLGRAPQFPRSPAAT